MASASWACGSGGATGVSATDGGGGAAATIAGSSVGEPNN
jgi:hypothetical protein